MHIDVKYLPKMQDEASRKYLFVAIDRATRWVYLEIRKDKSAKVGSGLPEGSAQKAPFKIRKILTDNGRSLPIVSALRENASPPAIIFRPGVPGSAHRAPPDPAKTPADPTAWVERSMAESPRSCAASASTPRRILKQTLENYQWAYNHQIPHVPWAMLVPYRRSRNGKKKTP